jgi:hypothetical protein
VRLRLVDNYQRLWLEVVLQALADIADEPVGSTPFNQSVWFFIGGGDWLEGRQNIADMLSLHADDLERAGRRAANARLLKEGLPPLEKRAPTPRLPGPAQKPVEPAKPVPMPKLVATFAPEPDRKRRHQPGKWRDRYDYNPFDPRRRLPSEERAEQRLAAAVNRCEPKVLDRDARDARIAHLKLLCGGAR